MEFHRVQAVHKTVGRFLCSVARLPCNFAQCSLGASPRLTDCRPSSLRRSRARGRTGPRSGRFVCKQTVCERRLAGGTAEAGGRRRSARSETEPADSGERTSERTAVMHPRRSLRWDPVVRDERKGSYNGEAATARREVRAPAIRSPPKSGGYFLPLGVT